MASDWVPVVAGAVAGAGTGLITSVIAPWANWGIEKKRGQRAARIKLIADGRYMIARRLESETSDEMVYDPAYAALRPHLTDERRQRIERTHQLVIRAGVRGLPADDALLAVSEQLDELERGWGLP